MLGRLQAPVRPGLHSTFSVLTARYQICIVMCLSSLSSQAKLKPLAFRRFRNTGIWDFSSLLSIPSHSSVSIKGRLSTKLVNWVCGCAILWFEITAFVADRFKLPLASQLVHERHSLLAFLCNCFRQRNCWSRPTSFKPSMCVVLHDFSPVISPTMRRMTMYPSCMHSSPINNEVTEWVARIRRELMLESRIALRTSSQQGPE